MTQQEKDLEAHMDSTSDSPQQATAGSNEAIRCEWTQDADDESWDGTCGAKWILSEGTPTENGMLFCPMCGGRLQVRR